MVPIIFHTNFEIKYKFYKIKDKTKVRQIDQRTQHHTHKRVKKKTKKLSQKMKLWVFETPLARLKVNIFGTQTIKDVYSLYIFICTHDI